MRLLLAFLVALSAWGADVNAASCSQADVGSAITSASIGDRVLVPSGNCTWNGLNIQKAIHLQGNGPGNTNITLTGNNGVTKQSAGITRISNFRFIQSGTGDTKGWIVSGSWLSARPVIFQGNEFNVTNAQMFLVSVAGGVMFFGNTATSDFISVLWQMKNATDSDNSWTTASTMGTADDTGEKNHYIEGNTIYGFSTGNIDMDDGSRVVYRYNNLQYSSINSHGNATSNHGVRHFEIYNNVLAHGSNSCDDVANMNWSIWIRGGTGVIYSNTVANIAGSCWGSKPPWKFSIRGAEDARPQGSCGNVSYPVPKQLGQSHNGTSFITDPIYIWSNSGPTTGQAGDWNWGNPCSLTWSNFYQQNRDYVLSAKEGYTAYTYPHPLASGEDPEPVAPTITTSCPLPSGQVGEAYSENMAATGDTPITWDLSAGALPDGLSLASGGALTGTPEEDGTFNFTLRATNATGNDTEACSVVIAAADPPAGNSARVSGAVRVGGGARIQ